MNIFKLKRWLDKFNAKHGVPATEPDISGYELFNMETRIFVRYTGGDYASASLYTEDITEATHHIKSVVYWIEINFLPKLTIQSVSEKSSYSVRYLQFLFIKETGKNLGSFIRKLRIREAAQELTRSRVSILDISLKYHYNSQ